MSSGIKTAGVTTTLVDENATFDFSFIFGDLSKKAMSKLLEMKGINKNNIEEKLDEAAVLVERYTKKFKINQSNSLLTEVITNLIK